MLTRRRISGVAKLLLGMLLFAQAAITFAACDLGARAPAVAISAMRDMPCCAEEEASEGLAGNANLCVAHCTSDAQRVDTAGLDLPASPAGPALVVSLASVPVHLALRQPTSGGHAYAAPPRTILFRNFRI
jgi:hypothetical protein